MNRDWLRSSRRSASESVVVQTWCRRCGQEAFVEVPRDYGWAVEVMYWLDDRPFSHGRHSENGGWGVHWRLDAVLRLVFPEHHLEDIFPVPPWYEAEGGLRAIQPRLASSSRRATL